MVESKIDFASNPTLSLSVLVDYSYLPGASGGIYLYASQLLAPLESFVFIQPGPLPY